MSILSDYRRETAPQPDGPAAAEMKNNDRIMEEDRILCERMQKGMRTRYGRGGRLVELDRAIQEFHYYLGWRLFDHELAEAWQTRFEPELRSVSAGE